MTVLVQIAPPSDLPLCHALRHEVFVVEQSVPLHEEVDGLDASALHLLARVHGVAVGTARMRDVEGHAKVERVAVLAAHREHGVGRALMEALHGEAQRLGYTEVVLHAQVQVIPFYERLSYTAHGEPFLDAAIWHREMTLHLSASQVAHAAAPPPR